MNSRALDLFCLWVGPELGITPTWVFYCFCCIQQTIWEPWLVPKLRYCFSSFSWWSGTSLTLWPKSSPTFSTHSALLLQTLPVAGDGWQILSSCGCSLWCLSLVLPGFEMNVFKENMHSPCCLKLLPYLHRVQFRKYTGNAEKVFLAAWNTGLRVIKILASEFKLPGSELVHVTTLSLGDLG